MNEIDIKLFPRPCPLTGQHEHHAVEGLPVNEIENEFDFRGLRHLAGWSQFQLAAATQIDRTRLSLIENDHIIPDGDEHAAIKQALLEAISRRNEQLSAVLAMG
jgi:hypothetical protein